MSKRSILDVTQYQKGNVILATNMPAKKTPGQSQELKMTVSRIYFVKEVSETYLRVVGIFSGEERTIPKEYCEKITLDNLAKLQVQLQSIQLAKVAKNLFKSNKYLGPNAIKTWDFLLNRDRQIEIPDHDFTDSIESELQGYETNNLQHEIQRDVENDLLPQVHLPEQSARGQTDVYGQAEGQHQTDQLPARRTRSGRVYRITDTKGPSILRDPTHQFIPWLVESTQPALTEQKAYQRALSQATEHGLPILDVNAQKAIKAIEYYSAGEEIQHKLPRTSRLKFNNQLQVRYLFNTGKESCNYVDQFLLLRDKD